MADLSLAAWGGVTARLGAFDLPLADVREDSAEMLVLDDGCLGNLPQLVKGGVGQIKPAVADCQPAIGIRAAPVLAYLGLVAGFMFSGL